MINSDLSVQTTGTSALLKEQSISSGIRLVYAPKFSRLLSPKTWRVKVFRLAREVKNLRAGTKKFWRLFSLKKAPESEHFWFVMLIQLLGDF
ncbi:DUF1661 domain-containing protein [Porphyromonas gulae]|uniref:DUF1661 domain-containing protein n=1 Tax=Porphyromonas gulae TaxID=111105 RepID=UPI0034E98343